MGLVTLRLYVAMADKCYWIRGIVLNLFYVSMFAACLVTALVLPWVFRMVCGATTALFRSIFQATDKGPTSHLQAHSWSLIKKNTLASVSRACAVRAHTDSQTARDNAYFGPMKNYSEPLQTKVQLNSAGWIRREDKQTVSGRTYKVNRRIKLREANPKYVSKPASWS